MIDERNRQSQPKRNHSYGKGDFARLQPSSAATQPKRYPNKPSIIFFGNERLATGVSTGAPTLQKLVGNGYQVAAVVANYEPGQSRAARHLEIAEVAASHRIPVLTPANPSDVFEQLQRYDATIGVLVAYGRVIPPAILELFPLGIINIHPSLLPLLRGSTPIEQAILGGTNETGVSLMRLVEQMDGGPIYAQQKIRLEGTETKQELADALLQIGSDLVIEHLPGILDGRTITTPQNEDKATYSSHIGKSDGNIDWQKPAAQIERELRAFADWPRSRTNLAGHDLIISQARVTDSRGETGSYTVSKDTLIVYCGDQAIEILRLQPAGKKEMSTRAFISGYEL